MLRRVAAEEALAETEVKMGLGVARALNRDLCNSFESQVSWFREREKRADRIFDHTLENLQANWGPRTFDQETLPGFDRVIFPDEASGGTPLP